MTQPLWKKLAHVAEFDAQIKQCTYDIARIAQSISDLGQQESDIESRQQEWQSKKKEAQKKVHTLELQIAHLDEQEKQKKEHLKDITLDKTYRAVSKELEALERARQDHEDALISAWHELEHIEKQVERDVAYNSNEQAKLSEQRAALQHEQTTFAARKEALEQERTQFLQEIPAEWQGRYEQMRHKVIDPIVVITGSSCSSCFYHIANNELSQAKRNAIIQCRNCYRLLYYDTEKPRE